MRNPVGRTPTVRRSGFRLRGRLGHCRGGGRVGTRPREGAETEGKLVRGHGDAMDSAGTSCAHRGPLAPDFDSGRHGLVSNDPDKQTVMT